MSRFHGLLVLVLVLLVGAGVLAVDRFVPPPASPLPAAAPTSVVEPEAGSYVCAVGAPLPGTELILTAARPSSVDDAPSDVSVDRFGAGSVTTTTSLPPVVPNTDGRAGTSGVDEGAALVQWSGAPVAVWREWRWNEAEELPVATVAGGCTRPSGGVWIVPGMSTVGSEEARLRIANPYRSDATVAVGYLTPEGSEEPIALQNLSVEARGVREVVVDDLLPERADVAAVVRVRTGRVAVEGAQLAGPEVGAVHGGSLLAAATEGATSWTIPWVTDGEARASWLWVVNPGDRTARLEVTAHTQGGSEIADGFAELEVPPGRLRRVDLRGTLPLGADTAAVTVRSDGAPVVASGAVQIAGEDPTATGFAVQLGAPAPSTSWAVSGGPTAARAELLRVVNPAGNAASYSVAFFDGITIRRPEALQNVALPPGEVDVVDVVAQLDGVERWSAFVTTSQGEVVVGRVGNGGEDGWHLVAAPGIPAPAWGPQVNAMSGRHGPGLVRRSGTALGVAPEAGVFGEATEASDEETGAPGAGSPDPAPDPSVTPDREDTSGDAGLEDPLAGNGGTT